MRASRSPRRLAAASALTCLLLALLAAAPFAQAAPRAHSSIIKGEDAAIESFPSLAFVEARTSEKSGFSCTGTVIAPRVILTAAHCIFDLETGRISEPDDYAIATGVADLRLVSPTNVFHVSQVLINPEFDPGTMHGDAGLLVLSAPTAAPAISLAGTADGALYRGGTPVQIAGWGLTDPRASEAPAILQTTAAEVQEPGFCRSHVRSFYPFYSPGAQLCTKTPPRNISGGCHGDSGGPAIAQRPDGSVVEIGIVSSGAPKCAPTLPNIFTRVDRVSRWAGEWVAAIEQGGPRPTVQVPRAKLPRMTVADAKELVALAMGYDFGRRFRAGKGKRIGCERVEREKVKCGLSWFYGPNDYFGTVTVYYAIRRNAVGWNARYTVRWVNDRCWFRSGHRERCTIHSKRR